MKLALSVLAFTAPQVLASHDSYACRDESTFYDVGCVVYGQTATQPPVIGIMAYGAADTPEAAAAGAGPGEGTMACILVKAGPYASLLPLDLIAVRPFIACKDLDTPGMTFNGDNGNSGLYFPTRGVGTTYTGVTSTLSPGPNFDGTAPGETLRQVCDRVANGLLDAARSMQGVDTGAPTGLPFLGTCPRTGGYLGRGGTAAGYAAFVAKDNALRGIATSSKDPHFRLGHGDRTDIRGEDGVIYNFLSAKNVTMNVRIAAADFHWHQRLVHGTKMAAASWTVRTHTGAIINVAYEAKSVDASHVMVLVERPPTSKGGAPASSKFKVTAAAPKVIDGVSVTLSATQTLTVDTGKWMMSAAISPFPFGKLNKGQRLLDVKAMPKYDADRDVVAPHGLFGQSYDNDTLAVDGAVDHVVEGQSEMTTSAQGEGAIEGHISDYKMAGPFATHFKYTRFDLESAKPRDASKLTGIKRARVSGHNVTAGGSAATDALD